VTPLDPADPNSLRSSLHFARKRRDEAWVSFESAVREVAWLERGLQLYGHVDLDEQMADTFLKSLLPEGVQNRPSLKQAMLLIMRANVWDTWSIDEIARMLNINGWLPRSDAGKRISDMASVMKADGILDPTGPRGEYKLKYEIADALVRMFPPITDYRYASEIDAIVVPDHQSASKGLAEDD
jgi:hypothetical protein